MVDKCEAITVTTKLTDAVYLDCPTGILNVCLHCVALQFTTQRAVQSNDQAYL